MQLGEDPESGLVRARFPGDIPDKVTEDVRMMGQWTPPPEWQSHWSQNSHCAADRMFFS
jgi:hypothetical protein